MKTRQIHSHISLFLNYKYNHLIVISNHYSEKTIYFLSPSTNFIEKRTFKKGSHFLLNSSKCSPDNLLTYISSQSNHTFPPRAVAKNNTFLSAHSKDPITRQLIDEFILSLSKCNFTQNGVRRLSPTMEAFFSVRDVPFFPS